MLLILATLVFLLALDLINLPASTFLASMIAAVCLSVFWRCPIVPDIGFKVAQGFIGGLVASSISYQSLVSLASDWPFIIGGALWGIIMGVMASLILFRLKILPGPSAFWCFSPGGAMIMVLMSGNYGADMRLVAFSQYFRVALVSILAIFVSGFFVDTSSIMSSRQLPIYSIDFSDLFLTIIAVLFATYLAKIIPLSGGALLIPLFLTGLAKAAIGFEVSVPFFIRIPCYVLVGWRIGSSFDRQVFFTILKALPAMTLCLLVMIAGCGLYGFWLWVGLGLSPLTAYLASCPGGIDAVLIIAAASEANLSFITAMQVMRVIVVLICGQFLFSWLTKRYGFKDLSPKKSPPKFRGGL
jgi:membrane AbrB-like protein